MATNDMLSPSLQELDTKSYTQMIKINVDEFSYSWTIKDFSLHCNKERTTRVLMSPIFSINNESKWRLKLFLNGVDKESEGYISLFLRLVSYKKAKIEVKYEFSIIDAERRNLNLRRLKHATEMARQTEIGCNFINVDALLCDDNLLPNDTLAILCKITVAGKINTMSLAVPEFQLTKNLELLLDNKKFCDVTLVVREQEFQAHKAILAARSPVFSAMFEKMQETEENRVDIDMDADIFKDLLRFIYTETVENLETMVYGMFAAASTYEVKRLKMICEDVLCRAVTIETAAHILTLADLHSADRLKTHVINFMNTYANVVHTADFKSMINTHPRLLAEAYQAMLLSKASTCQSVTERCARVEALADNDRSASFSILW
ncbi:PREDICTED: speckle-type POZ protein-like [Vollenhovia emeryi]|uniref:speckle-type POZ protein-like n=1 Tax=Vollenhovia emeryi TaxID=411798 RepID=UPI0005F3CB29|nr:PREDICTED: speckle-type POZ protein-like [Vollenhovia emeryi]XP_011871851.1 PREDICTED: speckle-type POZ protein-like [Vollenhovia emeryi]